MFEKGSIVLYEIFNNLLSGIPVIIVIYFSSGELTETLTELSKVNSAVLLGSTYLIGTVIHAASFIIQYISIRKIHPVNDKSEKHVAVRKNDKENWHYVEKWYVLSNSHLSLSLSLIFSLILLITSSISVPITLIFLIVFSIILLIIQSIRYSGWAKRDLENAYLNINKNV